MQPMCAVMMDGAVVTALLDDLLADVVQQLLHPAVPTWRHQREKSRRKSSFPVVIDR